MALWLSKSIRWAASEKVLLLRQLMARMKMEILK